MWGPSADEDVDLADIRELAIWAAKKGEIPLAKDWINGESSSMPADPMGHIV
jgi:hypothetical protein